MGCSSSRVLTPPKTPLEVIVYEEARRGQLEHIQRKEEKQLEKLRKKLERKRKKQLKKSRKNARPSDASSRRRSTNLMRPNKNESSQFKDLDAEIEEETQALINTDLCTFLLNQITFSTEFFGNFERETTSILAEFLNKENDFNKNLEDQSILMANPLDAAVQKWINFKPLHGADKCQPQPLQSPVIYVVFENIDISRPDDSNYDSIPPLCNVIMETKSYRTTPCSEELLQLLREIQWKGYVRLRLPENPKAQTMEETVIAKANQTVQNKRKLTNQNQIYGMASSGYGTEQDYDYAYITKLNAQKPLAELKMDANAKLMPLENKVLPDTCISCLGDYLQAELMEDSDDDMRQFNEESASKLDVDVEKRVQKFRNMEALQAIRRYKQEMERRSKLLEQRYINSQSFMSYFAELMRRDLAKHLAIEADDLATATYRGASIFTRDYEIIPAIHVAQNAQHWPECTAQFRQRERPIRKHPRSGEDVQWPTRAMIKQIETFGYHVIPLGYAPKRRKNPFRELEWRIVFPKAERYLERHLSYTQVKIFMIMKALIKTFIEPKESCKSLMFVMELLRMHLFWECERNFTIWPEEFLGDVLLRFIETFKLSLKQKRLRDYFIQERNLIDGIPEHLIMSLVATLVDIGSNPLMHILVAFRHLDYNEKFFPKLDLKRVFMNLTADNLAKLQELSKNSNFFADSASEADARGFDVSEPEPDGLIGETKDEKTAPEKFSKRACQLLYEIEKAKTEKKRRSGSQESIQVEFFFSNNLPERSTYESINVGLEFLRRSNLLEMLLDHFLAAIRKSIKFRNLKLSRQWLQQLQRFVKYYRSYGSDLLANDYENSIQLAEDALQELHSVYGTVDFEINDEVPEAGISEENFTKKFNVTNPYEEVLPMAENLPTIHNAMKMWERKLHMQTAESLRSSRSTRGSEGSIKMKNIKAQVHNRKHLKKERSRARKRRARSIDDEHKLPSDEENETDAEPGNELQLRKSKISTGKQRNRARKFTSNSTLQNNVKEAPEYAFETNSNVSSSTSSLGPCAASLKLEKSTKLKKKAVGKTENLSKAGLRGHFNESSKEEDTETVSNTQRIAVIPKKSNENHKRGSRLTDRRHRSTADFSSDSDEFASTKKEHCKINHKNIVNSSKRTEKPNESNLFEAYDNQAYSTDCTDHLNESINVNLKIENISSITTIWQENQAANVVEPEINKRITTESSTDNISLDQALPQLFAQPFPRSSVNSKASYKENRRICYDSDTDESAGGSSLQPSQSDAEIPNFEFKCLEDLSMINLKELNVPENVQERFASEPKHLDTNDLFDFQIIDERKLSKSSQLSVQNFENQNDIELQNLDTISIEKTSKVEEQENEHKNEENSKPKAFYSKYINRETVLKNFSIISPDMIETLSESKQKIKNSLNQEKLTQVTEVWKKRTLKLKKTVLK